MKDHEKQVWDEGYKKLSSLSQQRTKSNFYANMAYLDPFPDPSLINFSDAPQEETELDAVDEMSLDVFVQNFHQACFDDIQITDFARVGVFNIYFSQSSAFNPPL